MDFKEYLRQYVSRYDWFERLWILLQWKKTNLYAMKYSDIEYADRLWKMHSGKGININNPTTYNEKMWYLKLSNRDPLLTTCSDKHAVRDYVKRNGYEDILKKEYGAYTNAKDINFSGMPDRFYMKLNNGSGLNMIYDKNKKYNINHIIWKFNYLLQQSPYYLSREWNYKNIRPLIICEEVLEMPDGISDIPEVQFFCFNGAPKFIMLNMGLADSEGRHKKATRWVYDMDWNIIHVKTSMPTNSNPPPKPLNFERMVEICKRLSAPFPHVRVDLFNIEGKIYFNEMTFYSGGGFVRLDPEEWQTKIGEWIDCSDYRIADDAKRKHNVRKERIERLL